MEDEINEPTGSMLPIALGVLAIAIGGAGLYFGMNANQRLSSIAATIDASSSSAVQVEKQLEEFEIKLAELLTQTNELESAVGRLRVYSSQNERETKAVITGVEKNRDGLLKLVEQLNSGSLAVRPQPVTTVESSGPALASSSVGAVSPEVSPADTAGLYSIQSGDNFAKIASARGISLQALLDANPGVDPRRLQIGQQINLPTN